MNLISILIVDDDMAKISTIISIIRKNYSEGLDITQASSVQEAVENLQQKQYHLLITDLQLPLRSNGIPDNNGGASLISSCYRRKSKVYLPMYIVGLTQFQDLQRSFTNIWNVWHFEISENGWAVKIRDLIHHISLVKPQLSSKKIETVFVEGYLDKTIIEHSIKHFYPQCSHLINIQTINHGGGASWVERQLFIWAKSLTRDSTNGNYIRAVGLFDDDEAGKKSIEKILKSIDDDSAEFRTFGIEKSQYKHSPFLKTLFKKGIQFSTTIEDLVSIELFKVARSNGWLSLRDIRTININSELSSIVNELTEDKLVGCGFTNDEALMITHKVSDDHKTDFNKIILTSGPENLTAISYLVKAILERLKVLDSCQLSVQMTANI